MCGRTYVSGLAIITSVTLESELFTDLNYYAGAVKTSS